MGAHPWRYPGRAVRGAHVPQVSPHKGEHLSAPITTLQGSTSLPMGAPRGECPPALGGSHVLPQHGGV